MMGSSLKVPASFSSLLHSYPRALSLPSKNMSSSPNTWCYSVPPPSICIVCTFTLGFLPTPPSMPSICSTSKTHLKCHFFKEEFPDPHLLHRMDPSSLELPLCLIQMIIIERITIYWNYLSSGLIPPPDWASWETGFSFFPDSIVINTGLGTW